MKFRNFLGALVLVLSFAVGASAQEGSEVSGGGGGGVSTAGGSGTAGVVPQFVSATSLEDSKLTTSGTNSGTWTLYDDTATNGITSLVIRAGAAGNAWATHLVDIRSSADVSMGGFIANGGTLSVWTDDVRSPVGDYFTLNGSAYHALLMDSSFVVKWGAGGASSSWDIGLARSSAGILAVTDGSTGQGGIGLSDAATNTVTDALILRHATSGTATTSFGTGLLFQGEDAAGNMQGMASIDAVYTDATNGSEDAELRFSTYSGGAEVANVLTIGNASSITTVAAPVSLRVQSNSTGYVELITPGTGHVYLGTQGAGRWQIEADGDFSPLGTNMFDIGSSSYFVKDSYLGTSIQGTRTKTLTDTVATDFVTIAIPTNTSVGGRIEYTITYSTGGNMEMESGVILFAGQNEAGTEDADVSALGTALQNPSAGLMTNVFAVSTGVDNMTISCDADSTALAVDPVISYRVVINSGTATVTPIP